MDINDILKKPPEERPEELENLVYNVIRPKIMIDYFSGPERLEDFEKFITSYNNVLSKLAFAREKDYTLFRDMLRKLTSMYGEAYELLERMTNQQIDYVLARIREDRVEFVEGSLSEEFPTSS